MTSTDELHPGLVCLDRRILVPATEVHPRNMGANLVEVTDGSLFLAYSRWAASTTTTAARSVE